MFEYSTSGKGKVYDPNGKGILTPMDYSLMVNSLNGKDMVL